MTSANDDELHALRARAYGPKADIHLDDRALHRLRELEDVGGKNDKSPDRNRQDWASELGQPSAPASDRLEPAPPCWLEPLLRVRRSAVLIALGVVVVGMIIAITPSLVQRIQSDPIQAGAVQVARLSLDPAFTIPPAFSFDSQKNEGSGKALAFQEFHGLRVIVPGEFFAGSGPDDQCLIIYSAAAVSDANESPFLGTFVSGCSAGNFPARLQIDIASEGVPQELRSTFPGSAALQFVHDRVTNQVIVFTDK